MSDTTNRIETLERELAGANGRLVNAQDPRYDKYRIKCAELEGIDNKTAFIKDGFIQVEKILNACFRVPTYLDDASIDRVVRLLDLNQLILYAMNLKNITGTQDIWLLVATPEQKAEALCRTLTGESK